MESLTKFRHRFDKRARFLLYKYNELISTPEQDRFKRWRLQEGLISSTWQAWNGFARSTLLASATGATTASGSVTTSPYASYRREELCYIARQLALNAWRGERIRSIRGSYEEPTWGDPQKAQRIAVGFGSSNSSHLQAGFSSGVLSSDLQGIRNACAHITRDGMQAVGSMLVRYQSGKYVHPSDAIYWVDAATGDYAFRIWVKELQALAGIAVS